MAILLFLMQLFAIFSLYGALAGGRPNAFSEGQNAFAGVVNPANAVWVEDRLDIGAFWLYQKSSLNNHDNNPLFQPGKVELSYKARNLFSADAAIHKRIPLKIRSKKFDSSVTLATYSTPTFLKLRTKKAIPIAGTTPIELYEKISATSLIFSFKINAHHSIGLSSEYFYFSHQRKGFQNSDNPLRSVAPGHVTNNGMDHSSGFGLTVGWRWHISKKLDFGAAWAKKSYCGQYRRYRGFEPHHAENYFPQTLGAGIRYIFNSKFAGRLEVLSFVLLRSCLSFMPDKKPYTKG